MRSAFVGGLIFAAWFVALVCVVAFVRPGKGCAEEQRGGRRRGPSVAEGTLDGPGPGPTVRRLTDGILQEQPYYRTRRKKALVLAQMIHRAATTHRVDPYIAVSMGLAESALLPEVGRGQRRGSRGEVGYFQVMPESRPYRICGKKRAMSDPSANADTAMCYVAHLRELCASEDPWVYVSAYGLPRCPSRRYAQGMRWTQKRRALLCRIVGRNECERIWPR